MKNKGKTLMFRDIFKNRLFIGALAIFVLCVGGSFFYYYHQTQKGAEYEKETQAQVEQWNEKQKEQPAGEAPVEQPADVGHFHEDPEVSADSASQQPTHGGFWENGQWIWPTGYTPPYPQGQTSSNPFFADGVPEHLKCPEKWVGVYVWATADYTAVEETVRRIVSEVVEKYNPNRPIRDIWTAFIDAEKFYQAHSDIPPLDPGRDNSGAAPERSIATDRIDWAIQQALDYPEIISIGIEDGDSAVFTNAWRMELGFDDPDWNVVSLPDGRIFRERSGYYYEFTYTVPTLDGENTYTYKGGHSGKGAKLVKLNLNDTSDEELSVLSAPDFREALYNWEGK